MAIKILTIKEAQITKKRCEEYDEFYSELKGKALQPYICDNSGESIPQGTDCVAVVILPNGSHPNAQHQVEMLNEYVTK